MKQFPLIQRLFLPAFAGAFFAIVLAAFAHDAYAEAVRVFYRPDGGVSITTFVMESCLPAESEPECKTRLTSFTPYKDYPYDDIERGQLPTDSASRDKWRGEKGRGVWVDHSLVTKREKMAEFEARLEQELDGDNPDPVKVLKYQRLIEKTGDIDRAVLTPDDLALLEDRSRSLLATVAEAIGDFFGGIADGLKRGFLALRELVTEKLRVGSRESPAGITVYDFETGEPYCVVVRNGKLENIPGECTFTRSLPENAPPPAPEPQPVLPPSPAPEPPPEEGEAPLPPPGGAGEKPSAEETPPPAPAEEPTPPPAPPPEETTPPAPEAETPPAPEPPPPPPEPASAEATAGEPPPEPTIEGAPAPESAPPPAAGPPGTDGGASES